MVYCERSKNRVQGRKRKRGIDDNLGGRNADVPYTEVLAKHHFAIDRPRAQSIELDVVRRTPRMTESG